MSGVSSVADGIGWSASASGTWAGSLMSQQNCSEAVGLGLVGGEGFGSLLTFLVGASVSALSVFSLDLFLVRLATGSLCMFREVRSVLSQAGPAACSDVLQYGFNWSTCV